MFVRIAKATLLLYIFIIVVSAQSSKLQNKCNDCIPKCKIQEGLKSKSIGPGKVIGLGWSLFQGTIGKGTISQDDICYKKCCEFKTDKCSNIINEEYTKCIKFAKDKYNIEGATDCKGKDANTCVAGKIGDLKDDIDTCTLKIDCCGYTEDMPQNNLC